MELWKFPHFSVYSENTVILKFGSRNSARLSIISGRKK